MNTTWPTIVSTRADATEARLELLIPKGLLYFRGHFPDVPVLPGIAQVHWAILLGRRHLNLPATFGGVEALKFQRVLQPGDLVTLTMKWSIAAAKLHFAYDRDGQRSSSGRILLSR